MTRLLSLIAGGIAALALLVPPTGAREHPATSTKRTMGFGQIRFDGAGPERWAHRAHVWKLRYLDAARAAHVARRSLLARSSVQEAIQLACSTYGSCTTLWRRASCETGGTFSPTAANPSGASGLFQFLPSTWATTPYASASIWSPYASALAAGWMQAHGRGGEWVCQ